MTRNPIAQLASLGEEVLDKASQNPTTARVVNAAVQLKERVDDLAKRVRGLEALEQRIAALERKVEKLSKASGTSARPTARKTTTTKSSSSSTARKKS